MDNVQKNAITVSDLIYLYNFREYDLKAFKLLAEVGNLFYFGVHKYPNTLRFDILRQPAFIAYLLLTQVIVLSLA
jgi:hypothetical protein